MGPYASRRAEYRLKALACAEAAERCGDAAERLALLQMADVWVKLAEHAPTEAPTHTGEVPDFRPVQSDDAKEADGSLRRAPGARGRG